MARADPSRDDWISEAWQRRAADVLDRLAVALEGPWPGERELAGLLDVEARAPGRPAVKSRPTQLAGGFRVQRWKPTIGEDLPAHEWLGRWAARLGEGDSNRVAFKIVGVDLGDEGKPSTRVRYEAVGRSRGRLVQHVGEWSVGWSPVTAEAEPRIVSIETATVDEVQRDGPLFVDATATVLPRELSERPELARGGEYWYGRIDAAGEPNLMGHQGIAVGDVNGDGLEDLYVAMGSGLPNRLLLQQADGSVRDRAHEAGVAWLDDTKGVLLVDMDNDGDQDLLVAIGPTIVLCKNDGSGIFDRFVSMRASTPAAYYSLSVSDFDLDGDLDIYGVRYVKISYGVSVPMPFHDADNGPTNILLRNDGKDRWADVTEQVGLSQNNTRFSLIGSWMDYDSDGDPDLYVANDFGRNNLYRNDGGSFVDVAAEAGVEDQAAGMGVSWADYDEDGDFDLHVTNMYSAAGQRVAYQKRFKSATAADQRRQIQRHSLGDTLLANQGDGTFRDVSESAGVRMGRWGWGGRFADLDNDGDPDLVIPNGFLTGALEDDL